MTPPPAHKLQSPPDRPTPPLLIAAMFQKCIDMSWTGLQKFLDGWTPVSYTHLDVYKRQGQGNIGTSLSIGVFHERGGQQEQRIVFIRLVNLYGPILQYRCV